MSTRHRVDQAMAKLLAEPDAAWAHETWTEGNTVVFAFSQERSAQLISEALHHMFKSIRPALIHNGRKPR
jgi:hypothetical protein